LISHLESIILSPVEQLALTFTINGWFSAIFANIPWLQNKPCDFFYCGFELRWEFLTAQVEDLLISQNAQLNEQEGLEMFLEGKAED